MSLRQAFADTVHEISKNDDSTVVIVGDISHGIFGGFRAQFPDRYFNIGILEPAMTGIAAGMSKLGLNPIVHTIAPFLIERTFEQLKLDFGYQKLNVNLVSVGGTFDYSQLGVSHHSYSDVALVSHIPGSQIFLPGTSEEFQQLFRSSYQNYGIKYFRLTEHPHTEKLDYSTFEPGKSVLVQPGRDITLVVSGSGPLTESMKAVRDIAGIDVEVIYTPSLKPFDEAFVRKSVSKTGKFLTVEELSSQSGGLFDCVMRSAPQGLPLYWDSIAVTGFNHDYGDYWNLLRSSGIRAEAIKSKIERLVRG